MDNEMRHESIESIEDQLDSIVLILANGQSLITGIEELEEVFDLIKEDIKQVVDSESLANSITSIVDLSDTVEDEIVEMKEMVESIRMALDELRS